MLIYYYGQEISEDRRSRKELLGTTPDTLRKWESTGELLPKRKTKGGTRYYDVAEQSIDDLKSDRFHA